MAASKYPAELRERATRLCLEARKDPALRNGAISRIAKQTAVSSEALRVWVRKAETEGLPVETQDAQARIIQLEKENRELRRSNDILKSAAAFFAAEFDRPQK